MDPNRLRRSTEEQLFIIDSPLLFESPPSILVIGSTGNVYSVSLFSNLITCSCPDKISPCKHFLFLCSLFGYITFTGNVLVLDIPYLVKCFRHVYPCRHLDTLPNELCLRYLNEKCDLCEVHQRGVDLVLCNLCFGLFHSRHFRDVITCPKCHKEWRPYTSSFVGCYRNLSDFLKATSYGRTLRNAVPFVHSYLTSTGQHWHIPSFTALKSALPRQSNDDGPINELHLDALVPSSPIQHSSCKPEPRNI